MNIHDIHKIEDHRRQLKKEIYITIYDQFSRKIKNAVHLNQKQVCLRVPVFLVGYPTYDILKASQYLERQLIRSGFQVSKMSDIDFYVTWYPKKKAVTAAVASVRRGASSSSSSASVAAAATTEDAGFLTLMNLKKTANKIRVNSK